MDNQEKLATLCTQDAKRKQKKNKKNNIKLQRGTTAKWWTSVYA